MCCSSTEGVSIWIGALLVNIAFVSLITWGATTLWPIGFVLSALYTLFLLYLAQSAPITSILRGETNSEESNDDDERPSSTSRFPILTSLLYGLGVLSLGVTGFFLPVNLIPSCTGPSSMTDPKYTWDTNITALPSSVREWAADCNNLNEDPPSWATFAYVPSTGITIFEGSNVSENNPSRLWTVQSDHPPVEHEEFSFPSPFIAVSESAVCFQPEPKHVNRKSDYKGFLLYCSDGVDFRMERYDQSQPDSSHYKEHIDTLRSFIAVNGTLWFKEIAIQSAGGDDGIMIYSLDPETMKSTLHSRRTPYDVPDDEDATCNVNENTRHRAILSLLVSAVPMAALSTILWKTKRVPSMGILSYVSLSLIYITVRFAIAPREAPFLWFALSGFICLIVSAHLLLTIQASSNAAAPKLAIDTSHRGPLRASLATSAVAFAWGASMLFLFEFDNRDTLGWWIQWNLFVCWPLIYVGAATDSAIVSCLGGLGFLADAFRLAALEDSTIFFFLVFSLIGLAVGTLGYFFSRRYQPAIELRSQAQVQVINRFLVAKYQQQTRFQEDKENDDEVDPSTLLLPTPSSDSAP